MYLVFMLYVINTSIIPILHIHNFIKLTYLKVGEIQMRIVHSIIPRHVNSVYYTCKVLDITAQP